jgi:hypothetical protein
MTHFLKTYRAGRFSTSGKKPIPKLVWFQTARESMVRR